MNQSQILSELMEICQLTKFQKPENLLPKFSHELEFPIKDNNPFSRGKTIERLLIIRIITENLDYNIHRLNCKIRNYSSKLKINRLSNLKPYIEFFKSNNIIIPELIGNHVFPPFSNKPDQLDIPFYGKGKFKATYRCLTQPSLGFCLPDVIIDDMLIDIKTDFSSKDLKKYSRQVFVQSLLFELFLKSEKQYSGQFSESEIQIINYPIQALGIYYWRTNEFYRFELSELIELNSYQRLLDIYLENEHVYGLEMREILLKNLFSG